MVDFHSGISSENLDHPAVGQMFPGQAQNQGVELHPVQRQRPVTGTPAETSLVQTPVSQPDAVAVMHQHLHPVAASIGEQVGLVWYRRTKHLNHPRQDRFHPSAHVERFHRQPQGINPNHRNQSRNQTAQSPAALAGDWVMCLLAPATDLFMMQMKPLRLMLKALKAGTRSAFDHGR